MTNLINLEDLPYGALLVGTVCEECNAQAGHLLIAGREDIIGCPLATFSPPKQPDGRDSAAVLGQIFEEVQSGIPQSFHWQLKCMDGALIETEISMKSIAVEGRNVVLTLIRDLTDRKQVEEALEERNEFIEGIMGNLPIGLIVLSLDDLKVQYLNTKFEEIVGLQRWELINLDAFWEKGIPDPIFRKQMRERVCDDLESGDSARLVWEFPIVKGAVERADLVARALPMRQRNRVVITVQDITERKRAETELRERNEFIETIMDKLPIGFAVTTYTDQKVKYMNERLEEIVGWPKEIMTDLEAFWKHVFPDPAYRQQLKERVFSDWESRDPARMVWETQITKRSGEKADIYWIDIPMFDKDLMIATAQDITELKRAERLQVELECAAEVQTKLLPFEPPVLAGFEIAAKCIPARHVGGDFYDWQEMVPGLVTLTLGDVMGKGMAAAILTATVRAALRSVSRENPPAVALQQAYPAFRDDLDRSDSFVTLFHAQLNAHSRNLTFVDCGHGFVFLRRFDGKVDELSPRGLPLGVPSKEGFEQGIISFQTGDTLVLYSDGLIDALPELDLDNESLGARLKGATSAKEMVDRLTTLVHPSMPLPDDLTVLVVYCTGEG